MESVKRHFTACGIVFNKGKTLLLRHKKLGVWICPGGHIELNEIPDDALLREVREETGLDVHFMGDIDENLGNDNVKILHTPFVIQYEIEHQHIDMVYLCTSDTDVIVLDDESVDFGWFTYEETTKLDMFPNFRNLLKKAFRYMKATSCVGQF
jgi:ADP-ribose pyrophosphatase YjhB (NUDIX family)